jgi:hypothetical protein
MLNGKQRSRRYADQISELQRVAKKAGAERPLVVQAIAKLAEARDLALSEGDAESGDEGGG